MVDELSCGVTEGIEVDGIPLELLLAINVLPYLSLWRMSYFFPRLFVPASQHPSCFPAQWPGVDGEDEADDVRATIAEA